MVFKELTKAEEQIMHVLWDLKTAFVKEVIEKLEEPKPAYNTVSTIIRILESKGFVKHEAFGKSHRYSPAVSKEAYKNFATEKLLSNYFGSSVESMVSFFVQKDKIDLKEADEILKLIQKFKKEQS
jgi:predicted transcriptional regulator